MTAVKLHHIFREDQEDNSRKWSEFDCGGHRRAGPQTPSAAQRPKSILSSKSVMAATANGVGSGGSGGGDRQARDSGGFTGKGEQFFSTLLSFLVV